MESCSRKEHDRKREKTQRREEKVRGTAQETLAMRHKNNKTSPRTVKTVRKQTPLYTQKTQIYAVTPPGHSMAPTCIN